MSATQSRSVLRHVTGLFADRKIGVKIAIGFFCVLAITAAISAMANLAFGIVAASFETVGKRVEMVGIVRDVDREFLAMQRYVREFAMLGRERDMETAQARRKSVNDAIKDALRAIADPERTAKLKELAEQFDVYGKTFDALIPLRHEEAKLTSEVLEPAGVRLRADIQKLQQWTVEKSDNINAVILAGEAMKQLMIARLNVTRLLGQREQAAAEAAEKASSDLESVLTEMEGVADTAEARSLLAQIKTLAQKYHQTYRRAAEISERIDALVNGDMVKIGDAIATDAQAIKQSGIADQQAIEQSTVDLIRKSRTVHSLARRRRSRRRRAARLADRPRHLQAAGRPGAGGAEARRRPFRRGAAGSRPPRRGRRHGRRGRIVQGQAGGEGATGRRGESRGAGEGGGRAQGGDARAGRRVREGGRQHRRDGVVRLDRTGSGGQHPDQDRRDDPAAFRRGRVGVRGGLHQRAVGRLGDRGDDRLGRRDRPAGAGIEQYRQRSGQAGAEDRCPHHRAVAGGAAASATSSS